MVDDDKNNDRDKNERRFTLGLVPKIIIPIVLGIIGGQLAFIPERFIRTFMTFSSIFSNFFNFITPVTVVALVVKGTSDLTESADQLLGVAASLSYGSTLFAGSVAHLVAAILFYSNFITSDFQASIADSGEGLEFFFTVDIEPMFTVTVAIVFAFLNCKIELEK